jgi:hypothetical protein
MLRLTTEGGRQLVVRCVRKGERYGLNDCLVHEHEDPLIEFCDAGDGGPALHALARFPAAVVLAPEGDGGQWLCGWQPEWRLGPEALRRLREWVLAGRPGAGDPKA